MNVRWGWAFGLVGCTEAGPPEIWIDPPVVQLGVVSPGEAVDFSLQLLNVGGGTLEVQPFSLRGDDDCAIWLEGPDETSLTSSMQGFVMGTFDPTRDGAHQAALYFSSNAENYPNVIVPICAMVGEGAEVVCEEPAPEAANCSP